MKFEQYQYQRPDLEKFINDVNEKSLQLEKNDSLEESFKLIDEINAIRSHFSSMAELVSIRNSINTNDKFYDAEMDFFSEANPRAHVAENKFFNTLLNHKFLSSFEEKYGHQWFNQMRLNNKCFSEEIVPYLTEEKKLVNEYEKLLASARITFDGKINNLSQMSVYAQSLDRNVRKQAEIKKAEFMTKVEAKIDDIYDKLVNVRTKMAQAMGYENYVEFGYYRLGRSDYNYKDIAKYRDIIYRDVVPFAAKLIESQKKRTGLNDLKFYDLGLMFKDGNPNPRGDSKELIAKAYQMYSELSDETKDFFMFMKDHDLLDLETKSGKMGGGYTTYISEFKSPFIFSNFNSTSADVDVLTHEAGHAYEVYEASKTLSVPDVFWPTLEACEIHSMSMEYFAHPYMEYFFGSEASKYRYKHLVESILFLPYGVSVDEFQEFVYLNPNASIKERKDKWREIEKKYTPWKDYDSIDYYNNGAYWQRQHHIFSDAFYYIDYTLAQICAFNFYLSDLHDHESAFKRYNDLCKLGGSESFFTLLKLSNQENPFDDGVVKKTMKELAKIVKKLEKDI
ncbi:MAG: M3 family oligoendopeptidase [Acholeplasmatales bacterium]|nr:M3 family oligoendopeptidase [Acholeplasmatales bacterium]